MKVVVFDLYAQLAHFRRPDSTATHVTYPFITSTAIKGLVGAVLGLDEFREDGAEKSWVGIQLVAPVRTRSQELSMLGKGFLGGGGSMFNRPTAVELVVEPHYRIYYAGRYCDDLEKRVRLRQSVYPTYLGSAFAPCVPEYRETLNAKPYEPRPQEVLSSVTVVPVQAVQRLEISSFQDTYPYELARLSGLLHKHIGGRRFRGTISVIYEQNGFPIAFVPKSSTSLQVLYVALSDGQVAVLW